ncbi:glycoside hydrolase family 3 protein [Hyaloscypha hepaticicola]|uniref:xylan 1,4-beta-xylosidase n=1 Tax=Hyaloscypha hepaticicola TaxID=2082293 RepID=A0A2J6PGB0_9HELO|nr:glycoside hydrolase family 3 protein [Hyaloscypha hepaticicola]
MSFAIGFGLVALAGLVTADFPDCVNGPLANNTVCNVKADPYTRATALVSLFTFDEKISNTQNSSPGVPRIGLPPYQWWNEALHGVASSPGVTFANAGNDYSYATSFPQPILMGAAFDDELIHAVATVVSTEARAFNNGNMSGLNFWTPNINPYRDPRWGRGQETPGEDPFHLSSYVKQLITGLQGGLDAQPYKKIVATCKHFAGYDLENWHGYARYGFDAIISAQDLREYFLPPFQACARDSNVQSVMCSYNAVNGVPSCADNYLLQTVLREYWEWTDEDQWVTSDCDAVQNIYNASSWNVPKYGHNYTSTPEQAVADALNAGTDLDCGTFYPDFLSQAYDQGLYNISVLDRSLIRRYASLVRLGYFDPPSIQPYRQLAFTNVSTTSAQALALQAAEEGIVLLKNDGTLPLSVKGVLALIGPWAAATTQMQGNYAGVAPYLHSSLYAAQQAGFSVAYAQGADINSDNTTGFAAALAIAKEADAIVYLGGIDDSIEAESMDRDNITWPSTQLSLINQLSELSKPLIVVQMGTQVDSAPLVSNEGVNSLVWAGYPGQDGGTAILNILTGKTSPAGRLPVTQYPGEYVDQVPMTNMSLRPYLSTNYSLNNPGRTYKFYNDTPTFPFGFGLHYTNFSTKIASPSNSIFNISSLISSCQNNSAPLDLQPFVTIPVSISNTGTVSSDYVLLGFLSGDFGPTPYPNKSLVAYQRLHNIGSGTSQTGTLVLTLGSLARVNANGDVVLYPGSYRLGVDVDGSVAWEFSLVGEEAILDSWPAAPAFGNSGNATNAKL